MKHRYEAFLHNEDGFDFDAFLQSDVLATMKRQCKTNVILRSTSGSISAIASIVILIILYRSHDRLSTTQHRLIFGLCIADVISSVSFALGPLMVPKDVGYWVWMARGNRASCNAQGFLSTFGVNSAQLYNASLCLHYLAIVKYEKTDIYIRNNIEPWLHAISVGLSLAIAIFVVARETATPNLGDMCSSFGTYHPPHCVGFEDGEVPDGYEIPCGRGKKKDIMIFLTLGAILSAMTIFVIILSMSLMYKAVQENENKMKRYGSSELKRRIQQRNEDQHQRDSLSNLRSSVSFVSSFRSSVMQRLQGSATQKKSTNLRAILQRAFAYTLAWLITYTPRNILCLIKVATGSPSYQVVSVVCFFTPLQGLFNFLVFIYPRVLDAKRSSKKAGRNTQDDDVSWCEAFLTSILSRGKKKTSSKRRSSATHLRNDIHTKLKKRKSNQHEAGRRKSNSMKMAADDSSKRGNKGKDEDGGVVGLPSADFHHISIQSSAKKLLEDPEIGRIIREDEALGGADKDGKFNEEEIDDSGDNQSMSAGNDSGEPNRSM